MVKETITSFFQHIEYVKKLYENGTISDETVIKNIKDTGKMAEALSIFIHLDKDTRKHLVNILRQQEQKKEE